MTAKLLKFLVLFFIFTIPVSSFAQSIGEHPFSSTGIVPTCKSESSDPDGDGWGWENLATCHVGSAFTPETHPICEFSSSDPDGDGWGWENNKSCKVEGNGEGNSGSQALESSPKFICPSIPIEDPNFEIMWQDSKPPSLRNYDIFIDGVDTGPSVKNVLSTIIDVSRYTKNDTGTFKMDLKYFDAGDTSNIKINSSCNVSYNFSEIDLETVPPISPVSTITTTAPGHSLITKNPSRLALAGTYEQFYFEHVDSHHNTIQRLWSDSYSSQGTPTANELYFWMTPYQNMARMLVLADALGRTSHVEKYRDILVSVVLEMGPKFMNGNDAPRSSDTSKFRNNGSRTQTETRYAYLSLTRGLDWLGYVSFILKNQKVLTPAEEAAIDNLQPRFKVAMEWISPTLKNNDLCIWTHGGFAHMPSHMLTGMIFLKENGGYSFPEFQDCFNKIIKEINDRNGHIGSDISHDRDSVSNFMVWRDWQMLTGQEITVSDAWLTKIGNFEAAQIKAYNAGTGGSCKGSLCQSLGDKWIAEHALLNGRSNEISNYVKDPNLTNYPSMAGPKGSDSTIDSINQVQTVVSAAWGYANRLDSEL